MNLFFFFLVEHAHWVTGVFIRDFPDFSKIYPVSPAWHFQQTCVFFFFGPFLLFFVCLFVFGLNAAKKTSNCHIQFVVLFNLYFEAQFSFPFFLCNVIELNILSRSHALRHGKLHLIVRDTWGC